ncbi:unnamed protein product [Pleuronectes platessa]|uniref:Uncharacterized protein n=1 Tax=Pleuronectes platessa TaxID=8262 RepID=A0A9N7UH44_PLEPL|nr:unnamed protein product [Pleuronectes platessa]
MVLEESRELSVRGKQKYYHDLGKKSINSCLSTPTTPLDGATTPAQRLHLAAARTLRRILLLALSSHVSSCTPHPKKSKPPVRHRVVLEAGTSVRKPRIHAV